MTGLRFLVKRKKQNKLPGNHGHNIWQFLISYQHLKTKTVINNKDSVGVSSFHGIAGLRHETSLR